MVMSMLTSLGLGLTLDFDSYVAKSFNYHF
jgi:hypothetical protein